MIRYPLDMKETWRGVVFACIPLPVCGEGMTCVGCPLINWLTFPALKRDMLLSFDKNWSAPVDDDGGSICKLFEVIEFKVPEDGMFRDPVDTDVCRAPVEAMFKLPGAARLKLPDDVRAAVWSCGGMLIKPGKLFWNSNDPGEAAIGAMCRNWGCKGCCDAFDCWFCCGGVDIMGETQASFNEPMMFGDAVAMKKVFWWLLLDTIVGAVACG